MNFNQYLAPHEKYLRIYCRPNYEVQNYKILKENFLKENMGGAIFAFCRGFFFFLTKSTIPIKGQINKLDFNKFKKISALSRTVKEDEKPI